MLMAGPGFRFGSRGGSVLFARVLAGLVRDRASIQVLDVSISEGESRFGILAGGGIDFRVAKKLALRAQGDYLWNDVSSGQSSGFSRVGGRRLPLRQHAMKASRRTFVVATGATVASTLAGCGGGGGSSPTAPPAPTPAPPVTEVRVPLMGIGETVARASRSSAS